jgi:glycosyltransferase involved in cell wall biosynthesis
MVDELSDAKNGPLVVAGLFRTASGIGESARICADALERQGVAVQRLDLSAIFGQVDLSGDESRSLPPDRAGTLVLHLNAPETLKALTAMRLIGWRRWRVVGFWVWELEAIPQSWEKVARCLSEIWTPSSFSAAAISGTVNLPIIITPHCICPPKRIPKSRFRDGIPEQDTVILTMADGRSSLFRKNLAGAVDVFCKGLGDRSDCWLIVKTRNLRLNAAIADKISALARRHPRIRLVDDAVSSAERWSLINACDIYLSLHRSEGFGLTLAEAMALAKPVVATGWAGNMDFMDARTACIVPFDLLPVDDPTHIYRHAAGARWAEPDIGAAAAALRRLANAPEDRAAMGRRAQARIAQQLDGAGYVEAMTRRAFGLARSSRAKTPSAPSRKVAER